MSTSETALPARIAAFINILAIVAFAAIMTVLIGSALRGGDPDATLLQIVPLPDAQEGGGS